ncbi:MAG: transposase [Candidatus Sungbacteria bacterium]|uniref:Transposase n=1 Tax=Candidatus Sungiibacteriota bacterium TaxID=2750080 RepID=A0A931YD89_9BACT|nr:transposase [Candidatus Sungbacteria bacterium]MBI2465712.1 transposase [Candidatus Sungbacteria bacterium]
MERKVPFAEGCYYHIYNRGTEKRDIFLDSKDYERFLYLLLACNDANPILNSQYHYRGFASIEKEEKKRDKLVDIVCFCLMPNHFHIMLKQVKEKGVPLFMQKLGTGYTMYFNVKKERSGALFQGVFKAVHIDKQNYLDRLTTYIHLNPVELIEPRWKENGIKNWQKAQKFSEEYLWSSYCDYIGEGRFKNILSMDIVGKLFGSLHKHKKISKEFLNADADYLKNYSIDPL